MSVDTQLLFNRETVTNFSKKQGEPEWMLQLRLAALESVASLPLPKLEKTNIGNWNFTDVRPFVEESALETLDQLPAEIRSLLSDSEEESNLIVQKNTSTVYKQLDDELHKKGVIFTDLATAVVKHPERVQKYFMTEAIKPDEHRLAALHAALWSGGMFLYLPRGVKVDIPFQNLIWAKGSDVGLHPHVLVVAEANSQANVVINIVGSEAEDKVVSNALVEVFVGQGARIRVATLHNLGAQAVESVYRRAVVDQDGQMEWIIGNLNYGNTVSNNTTQLRGQGGRADVKAITIGSGEQRSNITSTVNHQGTHTDSAILERAVMRDQATSIINGITRIEKGATKANGHQAENVLMLSKDARGDANPILLIDENDVKAGHAASVGRIDPIQLFYLMSRGITQTEAEKLIIYGFLDPVLSAVPMESLRERLFRVVERKLSS